MASSSSHLSPPRRRSPNWAALGWLLGLALVLGTPRPARALDPGCSVFQYNVRTWRQSTGLPSNAINAVVQAADGHIWLGTPKGLVDFDGVEFREVGLPGQDQARPRIVSRIRLGSAGALWLSLERGGFGRFAAGQFAGTPTPLPMGDYPTTRDAVEASDGSLFVALVGSLWRFPPSGPPESIAPSADVLCIHEDLRGRVWFGTAAGELLYWSNGGMHTLPAAASALWRGFVISAVAVASDGRVWVGASNGLHCLNPDLTPAPPTGITSQPRALLLDRQGCLWIGTISGGLIRIRDNVRSSLVLNDGLASNRVLSLAESDDGSLWIGTEDGLSQLSDVKFPIISPREGLGAEACLAVAAAADGGIWAGTSNGLTHILGDRCTTYGTNRADGFPSEWVKRVHLARNGDLYFLGGRRDLCRFRDGRVTKVWYSETWPQALAEDSEGLLVSNGKQLLRLTPDDQLVPLRLADGSTPDFGWINEMIVARDGSLWVAAKPGLFQLRDGVLHDRLAGLAVADPAFFSLREDDQGAIWASRNSGLVRVRGGRIDTVDHTQGLASDLVYAFVADNLGNFWFDSPEGIFRVAQRELNAVADGLAPRLHCTLFAGQHAVKTSEKSSRDYSGCRSADGRIWFPSSKGVIRIDPAHVPVDARAPAVSLKRLVVDGREYPADQSPALRPGLGNLEISYTALDYLAPERIRYRYRLEGFQSDWVEAGGRRTAYYTNLPPGRYRFRVQACNADGVWSTTDTTVALALPPRTVQTWWFRSAALLVFVFLGGSFFWTRERRRRRELAEIRLREELQLQMIESSPVAMAMIDRDQHVLFCNATFSRLFGYTAAEIPDLGTLCRHLCPAENDPDSWCQNWKQRFATVPAGDPTEAAVSCRDGARRTIAITLSSVGERRLLACIDLTARKRAEDERHQLEEKLRQVQKMEAIGRLSGGVAHDFNNLLTAILGNVSLVESDEQLPPGVSEALADIKEASIRAANLTRQLLAFSRKHPLHRTRLDLNRVVADITRMLTRVLGEDIRVVLRCSAEPVELLADATMLEQILLNLAINARDAMPDGGEIEIGTALVEIAADQLPAAPEARAGRFVRLSVRDNGSGIPPEILPRIFEPFFTTKDVGKGTGLGLATVYGIVQQHHGWIAVESRVGQGTTFQIHLSPLGTEAAVPGINLLTPALGHRLPPRPCTILLVEDDATVRALARRALTSRGHQILEAQSGPAALELWKNHRDRIDILLTDVVMPEGINGLELARRLLAEKPALLVIYSSGYSADVAGGDFSGREGRDFLPKPYAPSDLLRIIDRVAAGIPPR